MQCWVDIRIDSTTATSDTVATNFDHYLYWDKYAVYFTATSADTWIQIVGANTADKLFIDELILLPCAP